MTAAGWYADPSDPALVRYWDGSAWTAHTGPRPSGQAMPSVAASAGYTPHPQLASPFPAAVADGQAQAVTHPGQGPYPAGPYASGPYASGPYPAATPGPRRNRTTMIVVFSLLAALVLGVAGVSFFLNRSGSSAQGSGDVAGSGVVVGTAGIAGQGTDGAPEVEIYLDLMCPYCAQFDAANAADLTELREEGEIQVRYHVISNLDQLSQGTNYSTRSANALLTVAADSPEHFLAFMDELFAEQPEENSTGLTDAELTNLALDAGVPSDVADSFVDGAFNEAVEDATARSRTQGIAGTPTVLLDGDQVEDVNYLNPGPLDAWLRDELGL